MAHITITSLLLIAITSTVNSQCTVDRAKSSFSRAVYEFGNEISKRIAQDTDYHFVTSPLSLWALLATISLGAEDETLNEIRKALHQHPHKCFNKKYYEITRNITLADSETTLERSGMLIFDETLNVSEDYKRSVEGVGIGNVVSISFQNFNDVAKSINSYVREATHGAIEEIVSADDLSNAYLLLLDAIYFKGQWKIPFNPSETEVSSFYDNKGLLIGEVNLMYNLDSYNVASVDAINATILELPYGSSEQYSMLIFLPRPGVHVENVAYNLENISLRSVFLKFAASQKEMLQVQIPKFKITSSLDNLKELLMDMGVASMFDKGRASFPYIAEYSLYVSDLVQKAEIEVTEEGTVASAVSEAGFEERMAPSQFLVNKPFLFMIVEKTFETVLFIGAYSNPTVY